jgi:hypothetical protein
LTDVRSLLALRDELRSPALVPQRRSELGEAVRTWVRFAEEKLTGLRAQAAVAESFVRVLRDDVGATRRAEGREADS